MRSGAELEIALPGLALTDESQRREVIGINTQRALNAQRLEVVQNLASEGVVADCSDELCLAAQLGQPGGDIGRSAARCRRVLGGGFQRLAMLARDKVN